MSSRYEYDPNPKGALERAREAGTFVFWCVMVGGGMGGVYGHNEYGTLYHTVLCFVIGMSGFAFLGVMAKLFGVK